jgi:catechol 2,3-dioxygenase-like lactoylglutathione lyase family enzyme
MGRTAVVTGLGQVHVSVADVARATEFYRDVLGLEEVLEADGMAFLDCGGVRLYLSPPEGGADLHTSILYLRVDDIDAASDTLGERGVAFDTEPHLVHTGPEFALWLAFFHDSEGNQLALMEERPVA